MAIIRIQAIVATAAVCLLASCGGTDGTGDGAANAGGKKLFAMSVANNVATYSGNRNGYDITKTAAGYTVEDYSGSDGTKTLTGVGNIQFADVTVNLGIAGKVHTVADSDRNKLIELYIAFFNRLPDADGLSYWIDQLKAGQSLIEIAQSFYEAGVKFPLLTGYSATMSDADFVKIIYKNVLGRSGTTSPPDADVEYWNKELASGRASRGTLIGIMLNSARSYAKDVTWGWVPTLLDNKIAVASYFAVDNGLGYVKPEDAISKTMEIAAAVAPTDKDAAMKMIDLIVKRPKPVVVVTAPTAPVVTPAVPAVTPVVDAVTPTVPVVTSPVPVVTPPVPVVTPSVPAVTPPATAPLKSPITFWVSQPVNPNETVLVIGSNLASDATASITRLEDTAPGSPLTGVSTNNGWQTIQPLQATTTSMKFVLPGTKPGVFAYKLQSKSATGAITRVNAPDVWFAQGDQGWAASPGGKLKVFGTSLAVPTGASNKPPRIALVKDGVVAATIPRFPWPVT